MGVAPKRTYILVVFPLRSVDVIVLSEMLKFSPPLGFFNVSTNPAISLPVRKLEKSFDAPINDSEYPVV